VALLIVWVSVVMTVLVTVVMMIVAVLMPMLMGMVVCVPMMMRRVIAGMHWPAVCFQWGEAFMNNINAQFELGGDSTGRIVV